MKKVIQKIKQFFLNYRSLSSIESLKQTIFIVIAVVVVVNIIDLLFFKNKPLSFLEPDIRSNNSVVEIIETHQGDNLVPDLSVADESKHVQGYSFIKSTDDYSIFFDLDNDIYVVSIIDPSNYDEKGIYNFYLEEFEESAGSMIKDKKGEFVIYVDSQGEQLEAPNFNI